MAVSSGFDAKVLKRAGLMASLVWLAVLLAACYPTYNWREMPVADGLATLAFPGKVDTAERDIELAGIPLTFVLSGTEVKRTVFAIGYARLPQQTTALERESVQRALVDSLAAGMNQTAPPEAYSGDVFRMQRTVGDRTVVTVARVLVHHDVAIRVVASGPPQELTEPIAHEFMRSLKLR